MGIDKDKSNIARFTDRPVSKKNSDTQAPINPETKQDKESLFLSKDVKSHFSFSVGRQFDRANLSKNSVTYDLNSFDEKRT